MQEVHVHAGTEEGAVSLGPGPMETLLDGMSSPGKSTPGCASIIMTYFGSAGFVFVYINQVGEIKFSTDETMRFVIIKQVLIVFIVVLMNKEKDHSLGGGWSWVCVVFCGLDVPIEREELFRVVLNP